MENVIRHSRVRGIKYFFLEKKKIQEPVISDIKHIKKDYKINMSVSDNKVTNAS
jgi:hypothetical protein